HAEQLLALQELDIVPGILLGAVDLGRAPGNRAGRELADAGLQLHLVGGQSGVVHEAVPWPFGSTLKIATDSLRPRTGMLPRAPKTNCPPQASCVLWETRMRVAWCLFNSSRRAARFTVSP